MIKFVSLIRHIAIIKSKISLIILNKLFIFFIPIYANNQSNGKLTSMTEIKCSYVIRDIRVVNTIVNSILQ